MITEFAQSIGNHLWQSTLFALCAAGLAFMLRGIPARTRYWIWFAASLKFLVPFSVFPFTGKLFGVDASNENRLAAGALLLVRCCQPTFYVYADSSFPLRKNHFARTLASIRSSSFHRRCSLGSRISDPALLLDHSVATHRRRSAKCTSGNEGPRILGVAEGPRPPQYAAANYHSDFGHIP